MKILGIETSCDDTAVAILEILPSRKGRVLSNVVSSQVKLHAHYGGVFPALAAREHAKNIDKVFKLALKESGLKSLDEIDLIAVTRGPGLIVSLLIGVAFARTLAWKYQKPLIGVNHLEGHICSNWLKSIRVLTNFKTQRSKVLPALNLIVSGGHTELVLMKEYGQYKIVGETLDDAAGEAFDKVARLLNLGYPGGPIISRLAKEGNAEKYPLPQPMANSKNFNFSYSGLKTAVLYLLRDLKKITPQMKADIAASFQKAAIEVLVKKTANAAHQFKVKTIFLSGGVSANKLLREGLAQAAKQELKGVKFFKPSLDYTTDNAAMIALAGFFNYRAQKEKTDFSWKSAEADANLKLSS